MPSDDRYQPRHDDDGWYVEDMMTGRSVDNGKHYVAFHLAKRRAEDLSLKHRQSQRKER